MEKKDKWIIFTGYVKDIPEVKLIVGEKYKFKKHHSNGSIDVYSPNHKESYHTLFQEEYRFIYDIKNESDWLDAIQNNFKNGV